MPKLHGRNTTVLLGSVNLSPYLDSLDVAADTATAETTTFGATWASALAGAASAKVDVSGYYDPAQSTLSTLLLSGVPGVLTGCPGGGAAIGDSARLVSALDVGFSESSPVGGVVAIKASFQADGVLGFGYMLHPLAEDTNTTTGATRDDLASTSTGWTCHLHVTAVDAGGGSWVIKIVDASAANMSDVADLSGASFTAATGVTSQRLRGATATATVRQYVRYVATRTGGGAGEGITFALAFSRN